MTKLHAHINNHKNNIKHFFCNLKLTLPASIILGSIIISFGIAMMGYFNSQNTQPTNKFKGSAITKNDYVEGNSKSKVLVIEYSDTECPFCTVLHPNLKEVRNEFKDKIAFVYRHFPLTQIHENAFDEARAVSCSGKIGGDTKYFQYVDSLFDYKFANQITKLPPNGKVDIAKNIALDEQKFNECMENGDTANIVNENQADGVTAGVTGTPTTFVLLKTRGGYEIIANISGAQKKEVFVAAIKEALAR